MSALIKPGKRLAKLLDPRCYIATEPQDRNDPTAGTRYRVFDADGKSLAHSQYPLRAWQLACRPLTARLGAKLGLTITATSIRKVTSTKRRN